MHVPLKVDYGVRALVDLGLYGNGGSIRAVEIASRTGIPEAYLAQVLLGLNKAGLVRSLRGPQGGHSLAKEASNIRLSTVMACLGGPDTLVQCIRDTSLCVHVPTCAQREVWLSIEKSVFTILDTTTIADLVERTRHIELVGAEDLGSKEPDVLVFGTK